MPFSYVYQPSSLYFHRLEIILGHGTFLPDLHRIRLVDNPTCICDNKISETVLHMVLACAHLQNLIYPISSEIIKGYPIPVDNPEIPMLSQ